MQRAEIWGVLVVVQGCVRMHVGVDNLNVVMFLVLLLEGVLASLFLWLMTVTCCSRYSICPLAGDW